jgi:hypothetical protein
MKRFAIALRRLADRLDPQAARAGTEVSGPLTSCWTVSSVEAATHSSNSKGIRI